MIKLIAISNTQAYADTLYKCLNMPCEKNQHNIGYEILGAKIRFLPHEHIKGASEEYIKHELEWYKSQDLNIKNHAGIENNTIWQSCATNEGSVNSNYGWCLFSKENYTQFDNAIKSVISDNMTKQAVMIYSRPNINQQWNDGIHANHDMICTIYVSALLRDKKLNWHVHMRSNDIWYGLRNDLAWQQWVQEQFVQKLNDLGVCCECGDIIWFSDSLHLYNRNYNSATKFIEECGY